MVASSCMCVLELGTTRNFRFSTVLSNNFRVSLRRVLLLWVRRVTLG